MEKTVDEVLVLCYYSVADTSKKDRGMVWLSASDNKRIILRKVIEDGKTPFQNQSTP